MCYLTKDVQEIVDTLRRIIWFTKFVLLKISIDFRLKKSSLDTYLNHNTYPPLNTDIFRWNVQYNKYHWWMKQNFIFQQNWFFCWWYSFLFKNKPNKTVICWKCIFWHMLINIKCLDKPLFESISLEVRLFPFYDVINQFPAWL